ncbi:class I SAM-dependent methyltransferase [Synechococcus sp. Tobar12-5m-g]|uniref:class I SAM-dependent DNA methyltransferase n=1 Tax=unclassified Synechococcus TaxID=2626047 RepID=UPI0020CD7409|nr:MULTISPECIES: class I SAM-dependent methyltransferase [unclassified Synechococcus]MCP9773167.1 class I SAM-dependent methyltransferase [Synechococcus sp. Tobar12-5m-g]MCP9874073.1 class I SAM-dependent methyltransferase [Synechococcus sp. Cruz CV-v-12]
MNQPFDASTLYYDLLYQQKDSAAEVNYVDQLLRRHGIPGTSLLEFGSGTGRHGCLLAERGYRVHGIERSDAMVQAAQQAPGFTCQQGDITTTRLSQPVDAVISLFHVLSYQTSNAAVQATFANAAHHLPRGGLFLFDVWYSPAVAAQQPEVRIKRISTPDLAITRIAEPTIHPNDNRVDVHYTFSPSTPAAGSCTPSTKPTPCATSPCRNSTCSPKRPDLIASAPKNGSREIRLRRPPGAYAWCCASNERFHPSQRARDRRS